METELFWLVMVGGFSYACSKCTGAEIWEWIKSVLLILALFFIGLIGAYGLLLAL